MTPPTQVRFYCAGCDKQQPVTIEPLETDELNSPLIWGDIICNVCRLVIVTISADVPGVYQFVRVAEPTGVERLEDKIEEIIAEFEDDPAACLKIIGEHIALARHYRTHPNAPRELAQ